ncbi:DNA-binding HxlR family transcriptional regulator [Pedobacter cryoconitis]|uniref:DNA-binding HxlR family transcriptional regulator n=1 Tax=Pedobacter cryoconitis TaxID=188932 RepID=A0A7W9DXE4_9SPHI|nr:helix-turn-helix domain-containing protein [Pedobacter cryoconitis]MBB5635032.1 DNA-binding HxlR family transcriptional regulator [Pedobacter cryoconitis]MBB6271784.1 DNA-binding HxlR family transcriptional regulator [Pedobacter cryoconitis]
MYERKIPLPIDCGLHLTKEVLNGKWKPALLNAISMDVHRPSELFRLLPEASRRVLTVQLKELEQHGIIKKKIYPQLPPKVEYSLTEIGQTLLPIIDAMNHWGDNNRDFLESVIERDPKIVQTTKSNCELHRRSLS